MQPFEAFGIYVAVKLHFKGEYDYFSYQGKIANSETGFKRRHDAFVFRKASKIFNEDTWTDHLVANAVRLERLPYVRELLEPDTMETGERWTSRKRDLPSSFRRDLAVVSARYRGPFNRLFDPSVSRELPPLLQYYYMRLIDADTLVLVNRVLRCWDAWDKSCRHHPLWSDTHTTLLRFDPFVLMTTVEAENILADAFVS